MGRQPAGIATRSPARDVIQAPSMFVVGKWSPESRSFRVRMFGNQKRVAVVRAPRRAQVIQAVDPATLELGVAIPLANE
jgi:hypothetical protein